METPTVLVIEDSSYLADSLVDMLDMHNYKPIHCPTGREGVAAALQYHPDLILLDIRLPDISGYEVYNQVRATDWGKSAKIMVLTASESIENIAKNIDLPRADVLFKPDWSMMQLAAIIAKKLATPATPPPLAESEL
ncbi:MAG: CRP/FNR family cyclic AMP-dependent transcriptional regulator [Candidatus Paceibacteria bacterium]|jgi:CRP/FNR family cyclic AMP-dependent transcriptional regulator